MMATKGEAFAGLSVAMVTPLRDGKVDYARLKEQVEFQVQAGTICLCPAGTTGESPTLSHDEHERVIAAFVQAAAGRIKVMAGTGSNSTAEALRLTKAAAKNGADAALVVAPYYNKPTQEGFYQHFKALAEAVEIPICVYNIPGRTGKNIEPETIVRLAELPNITMVKEATGSLDQASQIIADTNLTVLSRRRQSDAAADGDRRAGRDFGRRQHRAVGHDRADQGVRRRQPGRGAAVAPQAVPALPRHARTGDQPDSDQGGHEAFGPRHGRAAAADDAAGAGGRGKAADDLDAVWAVVSVGLTSLAQSASEDIHRVPLLALRASEDITYRFENTESRAVISLARPRVWRLARSVVLDAAVAASDVLGTGTAG